MIRRMLSFLFMFCVYAGIGPFASTARCEQILSNEKLRVEFDERGLAAIEDLALAKAVRFREDSFSIVIDGKEIRSETLTPQPPRKEGNRLIYNYVSPPYTLEAVYELRPGWRFVSKQILVSSPAGSQFRVHQMKVFRARLVAPPREVYTLDRSNPQLETGDYGAFLRFDEAFGIFVLVQNPFLKVHQDSASLEISYDPEMDWKAEYGPFESDRGCLGTYRLTGRRLPEKMLPEWKLPGEAPSPPGSGPDEAEVQAFTDCVRAFLLHEPNEPLRIHVGWCENDYQLDIDSPAGRVEIERIFDRAAELGAEYVLTTPSNSALARREDSVDDWKWEYELWLNLGQKIRKGEWDPKADPLPASVEWLLDLARSKGLKLVAYVYPVLPFSQNPEWLARNTKFQGQTLYASLGVRSFQDWLIENLLAFYRRTGIGGFCFDYTFLWYDGTSRYAQWWGWRRVLETLRTQVPDMAIDGRQLYQRYGPWIWLAGSYPHPTSTDEQPESFTVFPDLHIDRVSANRQRYTAYWYRSYEFCPMEIMPGFFTHQTPRNDESGEMPHISTAKSSDMLVPFRQRDWDYLGWRYSVLSSIATAGWNNVIDMIPARDPEEFHLFSEPDKQWFRHWLDWADTNRDFLRNTRPILGQPAIGKADGTSAILKDRGYLFLFNSNGNKTLARFALDGSIGLEKQGHYLLKEIYPLEGRLLGKAEAGLWSYGDSVSLTLGGTSALVLKVVPASEPISSALLFNAPGQAALAGGSLALTGIRGEIGTDEKVLALVPKGATVKQVTVNGRTAKFQQVGGVITIPVRFAGAYFGRSQAVEMNGPAGGEGGTLQGTFRIPSRVFEQLAARKKSWPIPWTEEDLKTTWLAPERLLLFVQVAEPDDAMEIHLKIDGQPVELRKAYASIRVHRPSFVGFYADVSSLSPGMEHRVQLTLPKLKPDQFRGLVFDNVETEYTEEIAPL
jgi:hypothetical protein